MSDNADLKEKAIWMDQGLAPQKGISGWNRSASDNKASVENQLNKIQRRNWHTRNVGTFEAKILVTKDKNQNKTYYKK